MPRHSRSNDCRPKLDTVPAAVAVDTPPARKKRVSRPSFEPSPEKLAEWAAERAAYDAAIAEEAAKRRAFLLGNRHSLQLLGASMPDGAGRSIFATAGCIAAIFGIISRGPKTRDEIVVEVRRAYRYAYRHAGYLLTHWAGNDPDQHLWFRGDDQRYVLHRPADVALKLAA